MRNEEYYPDPTAYAVLKSIQSTDKQVTEMIKCMKSIAVICGFDVVNRIELRDRKTGKVYR